MVFLYGMLLWYLPMVPYYGIWYLIIVPYYGMLLWYACLKTGDSTIFPLFIHFLMIWTRPLEGIHHFQMHSQWQTFNIWHMAYLQMIPTDLRIKAGDLPAIAKFPECK